MLNHHEIAAADRGALQAEIEVPARELDRLLAPRFRGHVRKRPKRDRGALESGLGSVGDPEVVLIGGARVMPVPRNLKLLITLDKPQVLVDSSELHVGRC
jgi:hypothetical protein